ncbi:MAG: hypothetical protein ACI8P9_005166 [Parasphingorhabdus sp.]|jgi:hypothetical protein
MTHVTDKRSRRSFLRSGLLGSIFCFTYFQPCAAAMANKSIQKCDIKMELVPLIDALRATGKPVCEQAARDLGIYVCRNQDYDLHLRNAALDFNDALGISNALSTINNAASSKLRSFSMSFNPKLEDEGAIAVVKSLPTSLKELGLVGCALSDKTGLVLLEWLKTASQVEMVCVEDNKFTAELKQRLEATRRQRPPFTIIV